MPFSAVEINHRNGNNDIYIVRLDDYKAMIEISDTSMRELAKI